MSTPTRAPAGAPLRLYSPDGRYAVAVPDVRGSVGVAHVAAELRELADRVRPAAPRVASKVEGLAAQLDAALAAADREGGAR